MVFRYYYYRFRVVRRRRFVFIFSFSVRVPCRYVLCTANRTEPPCRSHAPPCVYTHNRDYTDRVYYDAIWHTCTRQSARGGLRVETHTKIIRRVLYRTFGINRFIKRVRRSRFITRPFCPRRWQQVVAIGNVFSADGAFELARMHSLRIRSFSKTIHYRVFRPSRIKNVFPKIGITLEHGIHAHARVCKLKFSFKKMIMKMLTETFVTPFLVLRERYSTCNSVHHLYATVLADVFNCHRRCHRRGVSTYSVLPRFQ